MTSIGAIGTLVSLLTTILFAIGSLVTIRTRRLSREAAELRELRDFNRAALGYIYRLEVAAEEAANRLGMQLDLDRLQKPEILKQSFLEKKVEKEGNSEFKQIAQEMQELSKKTHSQFTLGESSDATK